MMLELTHVGCGALRDLSLAFGPGHHVVLGSPGDGASVLVELISGLRAPARGQVRVTGKDPAKDPKVRAALGTLLAHEPTVSAKTVKSWVEQVVATRGDPRSGAELLEEMSLSGWATRSPGSLDSAERRSIAMAIALAVQRPSVLALFEPLAYLPAVPQKLVLNRIETAAAAGACVLSVTASPRQASRLGPSAWILDHGRIVRRTGAPLAEQLCPGTAPELLIRVDSPRALLARLAECPAVAGLRWNEGSNRGELRVSGADLGRLSLDVLRATRDANVRLLSLMPALPLLESVQAADAGLARGAYERALEVARGAGRARAAPPAGPGPETSPAPAAPSPGARS